MSTIQNNPEAANSLVLSQGEALQAGWMSLAEQLMQVFQRCAACVQPTSNLTTRTEKTQAALEAALAGVSESLTLIESSADSVVGSQPPLQGNAWTGIGHAYAAAFASAGFLALRAAEHPGNFPAVAYDLARLAQRAAETLAHGMGLLLGLRRSGSIAHVCEHIGSLEGQADSLMRAFLTLPPAKGEGDNSKSDDMNRRLLAAVEAMTDRCEDVADALLAAARVLRNPQHS
jgi:hypothetical protein